MAHETPTVIAEPRDRIGTRYAQRLRKTGRLPAVIYGHKTDPVAVSVDGKQIIELLQHGAHLMNIDVKGSGTETCLVKELQFGYLGDNVIHVDFARVDLNEEVSVSVHLHFVGEPAAAKTPGAVVVHDLNDLEVICKASDIPEEIKVDLSEFESSMAVGDIKLPAGVKAALDDSVTVMHVSVVAEIEEGEGAEVAEGAAEPEVISEAKSEEEEEGDKE